jgi:hypothetical protein
MGNKGHISLTPWFVKNIVINQKHVYKQGIKYFMWWVEVYGCGTDAKNFEVTSGNYMPTSRYAHSIISGAGHGSRAV